MAVLAKPVNEMIIIKSEHSKAFIEHLNKHVMTKEMETISDKAWEMIERTRNNEA